jgi:hypothetical protein
MSWMRTARPSGPKGGRGGELLTNPRALRSLSVKYGLLCNPADRCGPGWRPLRRFLGVLVEIDGRVRCEREIGEAFSQ